jgi:deoxyadenosine/deoxycytidine kinase
LATELGKELGCEVHYEPVLDNEYLADFYKDPKRYSFALQVYLLNKRFEQHQHIIWSRKFGVQDRSIYEDSVFAKMLYESGMMEERDYRCYRSLFANMSNFMRKPDIIVHLDVTPEQSMERIRLRARDCESTISLDYLTQLHAAYEDFIADISRVIPVIRVDWSEFRDVADVVQAIRKKFREIANIHHVNFHHQLPNKQPEESQASAVSERG